MTSGPASGRRKRAGVRALSACLALAVAPSSAGAQSLTRDLFRPVQGGFVAPQDLPLQRTPDAALNPDSETRGSIDPMAPSRIGKIPTYGIEPASGASAMGYDSLNRKRQKARIYPGAPKPKPPYPGARTTVAPVVPAKPLPPSATANKAPVPAGFAGIAPGQPPRRRLKLDADPFGPVGDYAGSFLVKSAVELNGGYDTNPGRTNVSRGGSAFYQVAPEFVAFSDWDRHALVADLRGSFTGYGTTFPPDPSGAVSSAPVVLDRPDFTGHVDGRLDVSRDTRLLSQARLRVTTDNPGSPNIPAGLQRYPVYAAVGTSFGVDQSFNRLQVSAVGNLDRIAYQNSELTNGATSSNDDRNYNQYGGAARVSYDLIPGLKPFAEVLIDSRVHDQSIDRNGYQRDSSGGYGKAGTSFEFSRILTGEASIGYASRSYTDPRLDKLTGLLTSASLVWAATPLTTVRFFSDTTISETTLPGVSGVLTRSYTGEVAHDFRRWLTAIGRFSTGTLDYQGNDRFDRFYNISGDLIYKLNRSVWLKGQVRREWLDSNVSGGSYQATVVMLGVRLQH